MKYTIDEKICKDNELNLEEVFATLLVKLCDNIPVLFSSLENRKIIKKDVFNNYLVTQRWDDVISTILLDSDKNHQSSDRIENLALKLMSIFPKEKKAGTCHYFRGNKKDIMLRLKKFFKLYGKYSDEDIIEAAEKYVSSFNGNYNYMRILKYFIWKDEVKINAEGVRYIDENSDLANWIENKNSADSLSTNWTATLK